MLPAEERCTRKSLLRARGMEPDTPTAHRMVVLVSDGGRGTDDTTPEAPYSRIGKMNRVRKEGM